MNSGCILWPPNVATPEMSFNLMESLSAEMDRLEPQTRARSNTWPLPRPENYVEPGEEIASPATGPITNVGPTDPTTATTSLITQLPAANHANNGVNGTALSTNKTCDANGGGLTTSLSQSMVASKKNSSRRNAWGNLSYADLITQAITSTSDKRLTLSQVYEWMVQNVPYFKDKGDSNSSAGWKNSIRHNLSLHNRFMRVQNEGTGKSSWWMINPDAKPGKSVRRRAASMETSKFEKRRGRVKKKVELMRNGILPDATPSPSSSVSEGLDLFPDSPIHSAGGFQLSPDFRPRASSNTSSCGRLSPIPAVVGLEPDWSCSSPFTTSNYSPDLTGNYSPDQLAGNLEQGMKLQSDTYMGYLNGHTTPQQQASYTAPYEQFPVRRDISSMHATSPYGLPSQCQIHRLHPCTCMQMQCKVERMSPAGMSPSYPHSDPSPTNQLNGQFIVGQARIDNAQSCSPPTPQPQPHPHPPPSQQQQQQGTPSTMMGQLMGALNNSSLLDDLNINVESLQGGFDCNVEELIRHELSMEGSLDFNFSSQQQQQNADSQHHQDAPHHAGIPNGQATTSPPYSSSVTAPSWVH